MAFGMRLQEALNEFTSDFLPHMKEEEEVFQVPCLLQLAAFAILGSVPYVHASELWLITHRLFFH